MTYGNPQKKSEINMVNLSVCQQYYWLKKYCHKLCSHCICPFERLLRKVSPATRNWQGKTQMLRQRRSQNCRSGRRNHHPHTLILGARAANLKNMTMAKLEPWTPWGWIPRLFVHSESLLEDTNAMLQTIPTSVDLFCSYSDLEMRGCKMTQQKSRILHGKDN